ncbi:MAG TPA: ribosome maturation factor RimM [Solirubrobacteraceae bacterium]|jgi:16S rRNA processing protein RimM
MSRASANQITAGHIGRAHGLDGSFYVTQPIARLLQSGVSLTVAGHTAKIVRRAGTEQRPIVRLEGTENRDQAQALRGQALLLELQDAPRLAGDEYWAHELVGCTVLDGERVIGVVERLVGLPSCEVLEVLRGDGRELLVPMVHDAIREVDTLAGRITLDMRFLGES